MGGSVAMLEDDGDISRLVQFHLSKAGYAVRAFTTGRALLQDVEKSVPSLFLLDVMVPDGSGLDVCRRIRQLPDLKNVPVIFLTARAAESDRVHGLELGADDYVTKPFSPRELVARVRAVLRRTEHADARTGPPETPGVLEMQGLRIDSAAMQLEVRGAVVPTTTTEFRLLDYLARHPGRMFSRDQLLDAVWGDQRFVTPRSVDVYIRRIREKIELDPEDPRYLKTMRGAGYRFELPRPVSPPSATTDAAVKEA